MVFSRRKTANGMKSAVNAFLWLLIATGIVLLVFPKRFFPAWYDVRYTGAASLGGAFAIQSVAWLFRVSPRAPGAERKNRAVQKAQFLVAAFVLSNMAGDFGLFKLRLFPYDKMLHAILPFAGMIALPSFFTERFEIKPAQAACVVFTGLIAALFGWEAYEHAADILLKTRLFGIYGLNTYEDTKFDILFGIAGSLLGAAVLLANRIARQRRKTKRQFFGARTHAEAKAE